MYDIKMDDEGARVRNRVFKTCKKYLHHIQLSVFEGQLNKSELFELKVKLEKIVRDDCDSLIIFDTVYDKPMHKTFIGLDTDATSNFL